MADPFVSVIMPVRNEEGFIARSLGAALSQNYPPERIEVLVADGQSDDRTREVIASLPGAERVRVIDNPQRRQAFGLNLALRQARGDIIVRVDGHTIIAPDYVRQCVRALRESGAVNVGGRMEPQGATPIGRAIAAAGASRFGVPTAFHVSPAPQFTDTVYMGAWPREALLAAGGFDERLRVNEDYELNHRLRRAGGRVYLSPAIRSTYFGRQTLSALARQYFAYGWDRTNTLKLHPDSLKPRQLVAPVFVAALLIGGALATVQVTGRIAWMALLAVYALADLAASAQAARRAGWELLPRLPIVFATMHVAWGLGFWKGLLFGGSLARRESAPAPFDAQTQGGHS
ncbi:MAG TPA: glycosyltransferase family 2 protein [Ktedonobacterales bacterium]|jgi:glycosyltransferase involved in cell wall biosynthesis|nr:glycosyltransferase family 2 protein [Ktedonobacterales bacterium]